MPLSLRPTAPDERTPVATVLRHNPAMTDKRSRQSWRALLMVAAVIAALIPTQYAAAQSMSRVTGVVTDVESKQPIPGVTVRISGTTTAATTGDDGRYVLSAPFSGVYSIIARRIGYGERTADNIRLTPDSVLTVNFQLNVNQLRLNQVTVSASVDPTSGNKTPYTVDKLTAADIPVPTTTSAAGALIGKVAGATITRASGAPGSGVYVQLRSPVSQFRSNSPLYVVDGVFLNSTQAVTTQDIEALDIETIEVIKGAAAAALYGSRAAGGVISITTARGANLALGQTQFTLRTEAGRDFITKAPKKPLAHQFLVNEQGQYIDADGNVVTRANRIVQPSGIMENEYIDPLYDNIDQFFNPGTFNAQTLTLQQNSASTNFTLSYTRNIQPGVIEGSNGYNRQSMRLNVDHRIKEKLSVGISVSHTRGTEDPANVDFRELFRQNPDVNLRAPDSLGRFKYAIIPDPLYGAVNPLYEQVYAQSVTNRVRTLLNLNSSFRPTRWLSFDGYFSYDRGDRQYTRFIPRNQVTLNGESLTTGYLRIDDDDVDGLNAQFGSTITKPIGDMTVRLTARAETQREVNPFMQAVGSNFTVSGVKRIDVATERTATSTLTDRRTNAGFTSLAVDYAGKYIADGLVRREGSSLFGPDNRWNTFYRGSAAWLINEESWFNVDFLDLFKVRYTIGTAGVRPGFSDQYEALSVTGGAVTRTSLGNRLIKPEIATEQEVGLDMIINQKISASLVYVSTKTDGNLVEIPLPALAGYNTVWANVGTMTGNTLEATVQANLLSNPNGLQWDVLFTGDKSRNYIGEFGRTCYFSGAEYLCENTRRGIWYGNTHTHEFSQLPERHANSHDQFQIDDMGYLVPVGVGNNYTDGQTKNLWNTTVRIDGVNYAWGRPFLQLDSTGVAAVTPVADFLPDFRFGFGNTFRYKGFRLYTLFTGQVGGEIYNRVKQALYNTADHPDVDQRGKPAELRKPTSYYGAGIAQNNNNTQREFVESATHARMQELAFGYLFDVRRHPWISKIGASRIQADLIGRNILTISNYSGLNVLGSSGALIRNDTTEYPQTSTWTAAFTITF